MKLFVQIQPQEIHVLCHIPISGGGLSFALAQSMEILSIHAASLPLSPKQTSCTLPFRPPMYEYSFCDLPAGELVIEYQGRLCGAMGFLQKEIFAFSLYNGWYPVGSDLPEEYEVFLQCSSDYQVINATFDCTQKLWHYRSADFDCNIIGINPTFYHRLHNDYLTLWYLEEAKHPAAANYYCTYTAVRDYYLSLYGADKVGQTTIVFLPDRQNMGAYKRSGLIVFSAVDDNIDNDLHRLAHEMGHAYAAGADMSCWEDWLNETNAEWSALLYAVENNPSFFAKRIAFLREEHGPSPLRLHENGGSRPNNVHETGTLIYYELYCKYGIDAIKELVRTFDRLPVKTTDALFAALTQCGYHHLVQDIKQYL